MQPVALKDWGGLMLNLLLAVAGIALSMPIGIGLALGRRSDLPIVKLLCVVFIEVFRGVPLITLLFMSQVLVPLAFPEDFPLDPLPRAAIVITLFSSAYMAENIRGGLQALHPGQAEAARALGLPGWQITLLISLPQAIRNVIPAIVGQFIALFKDTSLVYIIGMLDIVEFSRAFIQGNPEYSGQRERAVHIPRPGLLDLHLRDVVCERTGRASPRRRRALSPVSASGGRTHIRGERISEAFWLWERMV